MQFLHSVQFLIAIVATLVRWMRDGELDIPNHCTGVCLWWV